MLSSHSDHASPLVTEFTDLTMERDNTELFQGVTYRAREPC